HGAARHRSINDLNDEELAAVSADQRRDLALIRPDAAAPEGPRVSRRLIATRERKVGRSAALQGAAGEGTNSRHQVASTRSYGTGAACNSTTTGFERLPVPDAKSSPMACT